MAVGNTITRTARPLVVLPAEPVDRLFAAIRGLCDEWGAERLVVGIPRHPDGAAHAMTARCERFANRLSGHLGHPVERVDERYSTVETGGGDDAEAAAVILRQYLDGQPPAP